MGEAWRLRQLREVSWGRIGARGSVLEVVTNAARFGSICRGKFLVASNLYQAFNQQKDSSLRPKLRSTINCQNSLKSILTSAI